MAYEATRTVPAADQQARARLPRRALAALRGSEPLRAALGPFLWTRAAILAVAVFAAQFIEPARPGAPDTGIAAFDVPALTHSLHGFGDVLLSPLARWDAVWYLSIAHSGYGHAAGPTAFFPLYPLLVRGGAELGGGSPGALLVASYVVSLGALLGALVLLYRLVALELGRQAARTTLLLLCVFPGSLFFGAPYSESVFLLASVAAFYAARTGHFAWAGLAGGAAAATRSAGVLLLLPLALMYVIGPRPHRPGESPPYALRPDAAWLALVPLGLAAYVGWLAHAHGDGLAFLDVQHVWYRHFAGPLGGAWQGAVAAFEGARQLLSGAREPVYFTKAGGDPFQVAGMNLMLFAFLVLAVAACVGALRRLPLAYGAYAAAALLLPLSFPVGPQPLMSLPRFMAVLFPLFMWLALRCATPERRERVVAVSALVLGLFVTQFATWHWVA